MRYVVEALGGSALAIAVACTVTCGGSSSQPNRACTPGASVACVGTGGCAGGQVCDADGSGFGVCACAGGVGDAGGGGSSGGSSGAVAEGGGNEGGGDAAAGSSGGNASSSGGAPDGAAEGSMGTGTCKSGTYSGTFQCTFMFSADSGGAPDASGVTITGAVSLYLAPADGGSPGFAPASGNFSGAASGSVNVGAVLGGVVDCGTGAFTGQLTNGTYSLYIFASGTFSSPLAADYDATTSSFVNGTWQLDVAGQGTCVGSWMAGYTGG